MENTSLQNKEGNGFNPEIILSSEGKAEVVWQYYYSLLKQFWLTHHHCKVPKRYKDNPQLGIWVVKQRSNKKLSEEQRKKLNDLNFLWKEDILRLKQEQWESMYGLLNSYHTEQGNCNVPKTYSNKELVSWVSYQRRCKTLTPPQKAKLNLLGFKWKEDLQNEKEKVWEERYQELKVFYKKNGHCRVTYNRKSIDFKQKKVGGLDSQSEAVSTRFNRR